MSDEKKTTDKLDATEVSKTSEQQKKTELAKEIGGREGPEPTRYGDWENNGIISDF